VVRKTGKKKALQPAEFTPCEHPGQKQKKAKPRKKGKEPKNPPKVNGKKKYGRDGDRGSRGTRRGRNELRVKKTDGR